MRVALAAVGLALGAATAVTASSTTALRIAYDPDGRGPRPAAAWTVRCDPTGGTLPTAPTACRRLARLGWQTLRPVPPDTACTEIYGGPQTALVTGLVDGRRVWARLRRDDGCQIDRWDRNRFLLPAGAA